MNTVNGPLQFSSEEPTQPGTYPGAPWYLQGQLYGSIWTVPAKAFTAPLPGQFKPLVNLGRIGVYAGFVDYQPGSTLAYHELIAGVVIRLAGTPRLAFTVTGIWVDSMASLRGGRELWGVPKEMAQFSIAYRRANRDFSGSATAGDGTVLARGEFEGKLALPRGWRVPVPFPDVQMLHDRPYRASGTFWSRLEWCRGGMTIPAQSPLAALGIAGRTPLLSFGGLGFKMKLQAARPL